MQTYLCSGNDEEQQYDGLDFTVKRDEVADEIIRSTLIKRVTKLLLRQQRGQITRQINTPRSARRTDTPSYSASSGSLRARLVGHHCVRMEEGT